MPWVPQRVLDELIEASRLLREQVAAPRDVVGAAAPAPPPVVDPVVSTALPAEVVEACERYAFGDAQERAENYLRARAMIEAGTRPSDVVRRLRSGGTVPVGIT